MKPDKHKQKRTQQYKKKHGISADKETQSKALSSQSEQKKQASSSHKQSLSEYLPDTSPSQSDGDDDGASSHRHRVLQSNWERYEELPQEADDITSRGADFSTLLQSSSSAVSQFRFADELALEEDITDKQTPAYLTIEPNQLVAALACIPLHKKLNIDEKYFEKECIEMFFSEAENNRKLYDKEAGKWEPQQMNTVLESSPVTERLNHVADNMDLDSCLLGVSSVHGNVDSKNNLTKLESEQSNITCDVVQDLDDLLSGEGITPTETLVDNSTGAEVCVSRSNSDPLLEDQKFSQSAADSGIIVCDMPVRKVTEDVKIGTNIEDELDKLLFHDDEDNGVVKGISDMDKKTSEKLKCAQEVTNIEDELDKLLFNDDDDDGVIKVICDVDEKTSEKLNCAQEESKDLEDWLDSVLDDTL